MIEIEAKLQRNGFDLDVSITLQHRVTALFGPSGSGKSTLLSIITGITKPNQGHIEIDGECLFDHKKGINKAMHHRKIGLVFQDGRLFPNMNVEQNLRYGLSFTPKDQQKFKFAEIVNMLEVEALLKRHPNELSGGEKQRVALGRALLSSPRLLMLDEPLASLDERLKSQILPFLKIVAEQINIPMIYVSHSKEEIMQITNNLINIYAGKIVN
jgi:molybdate transport system ATP-binding protein